MSIKSGTPVFPLPMTVSNFLHFKDEYKIDKTYQREEVWNPTDKKWFIDTLLRGFPIPIIFVHKCDGVRWIVDGQQRLSTIRKFCENKIELDRKISEDIIKENGGGIRYRDLNDDYQQNFLNYSLPIVNLDEYSDEDIRGIYRRLQRGKPLNAGELLNAYPGDIVLTMRQLAKHPFFSKPIYSNKSRRYKYYQLAATLLYLEKEWIEDVSAKLIYAFFDNNSNLTNDYKEYKHAVYILNYLEESFQEKTPELSRPCWLYTIYLLTSYLLDHYSMQDQKQNLKTFFIKFYSNVKNSATSNDPELIDFNMMVSKGTTSKPVLLDRHKIILKRFLGEVNLQPLDENRFFDEEQKREIFRRDNGRCTECGKELVWNDSDTHYHHKERWISGGTSNDIKNGQLLCRKCHLSVLHGKNISVDVDKIKDDIENDM